MSALALSFAFPLESCDHNYVNEPWLICGRLRVCIPVNQVIAGDHQGKKEAIDPQL